MPSPFPPAPPIVVPIVAGADVFPVRRIYCVGRNYAEHVKEMGGTVEKGRPVFFTKPTDAIVLDGGAVPYPPGTQELHHEAELVVAIGRAGRAIAPERAFEHVFGYAVGNDLTRRDLQRELKAKGLPWDLAKAFDHSAPISAIAPAERIGHPRSGRLRLWVGDRLRQDADLSEMIWSVPEIIHELSLLYALAPGDLIYTGTPAGVGPLLPGDTVRIEAEGVGRLQHRVVEASS